MIIMNYLNKDIFRYFGIRRQRMSCIGHTLSYLITFVLWGREDLNIDTIKLNQISTRFRKNIKTINLCSEMIGEHLFVTIFGGFDPFQIGVQGAW